MSVENQATPSDPAGARPSVASRPTAPTERELDEIAVFLSLVRRAGEPGPESWLYRAPPVAAPRLTGRPRPAAAG